MNTLEAAALMLPSLWIYAIFNGEIGAFVIGVIWLLGRASLSCKPGPARHGLRDRLFGAGRSVVWCTGRSGDAGRVAGLISGSICSRQ